MPKSKCSASRSIWRFFRVTQILLLAHPGQMELNGSHGLIGLHSTLLVIQLLALCMVKLLVCLIFQSGHGCERRRASISEQLCFVRISVSLRLFGNFYLPFQSANLYQSLNEMLPPSPPSLVSVNSQMPAFSLTLPL